jgi:hypothetical protein
MKQIDEKGLAAYLDRYFQGRQPFEGTVVAVRGGGPFEIQVQRTGEALPDPHTHLCAVPAYHPQPGDRVKLIPLDDNHAAVAYPLGGTYAQTGPARFAEATYLDGQWLPAGAGDTTSITQVVLLPYKAVEVIWQANGTLDSNLFIRINQDTGNNYYGDRAVVSGNVITGFQDNPGSSNSVGLIPATGTFGSGRILIHARSDSHGIGWEASSQANFYSGTTGSMHAGGTYAGSGPLQYITLRITSGVWNAADFSFYGYL